MNQTANPMSRPKLSLDELSLPDPKTAKPQSALKPILKTADLKKSYGGKAVVNGLSFL